MYLGIYVSSYTPFPVHPKDYNVHKNPPVRPNNEGYTALRRPVTHNKIRILNCIAIFNQICPVQM